MSAAAYDPAVLAQLGEPAADGRRVALRAPTDADLPLLHDWMQDPDVSRWWQLDGPIERVAAHLAEQRTLPHTAPWIATVDGAAFAYAETYLPEHDPLAAHYDARPADRGFHLLVGAGERGSGAARALVRLLVRGLLAEPGADRVLCEPNVDNARMLAFCRALGGQTLAELDLPHKRAALIAWQAPIAEGAR